MALNFPTSPSYNDEYITQYGTTYKYDGNRWVFVPYNTSANAHIGLEPPPSPEQGDLWWYPATGVLYIYYVEPPDGGYDMYDSTVVFDGQWVQAVIPDVSYGLPLHDGYNGKCLMTNGKRAYWGDVSVIPIAKPNASLSGTFYEGSVMSNKEITFTSSEFTDTTGTSNHVYTDWRVLTQTREVVFTSIDDTINLTELTLPPNMLYGNQTYILQIRYVSDLNVFSDVYEMVFTTVHPMSIVNSDNLLSDPSGWVFDEEADTGFYGVLPSHDFITGSSLSSKVGLSAGALLYDYCDWLKFYVGANAVCNKNGGVPYIIYVAKLPVRSSIAWSNIDLVGAVDGTSVISIDDKNYKVRLLFGATTNPTLFTNGVACEDKAGENSEWNELMYRIHEDVPTCIDASIGMPVGYAGSQHGGAQQRDNWLYLSDEDMATNTNVITSSLSHCQEKHSNGDNVERGYYGIAGWNVASSAASNRHWRPVLELVNN